MYSSVLSRKESRFHLHKLLCYFKNVTLWVKVVYRITSCNVHISHDCQFMSWLLYFESSACWWLDKTAENGPSVGVPTTHGELEEVLGFSLAQLWSKWPSVWWTNKWKILSPPPSCSLSLCHSLSITLTFK